MSIDHVSSENPLWYKDAIIYELHVKTFLDSSQDGFGDFAGLTKKLDYLHDLGVNTLWLLPFYPSPLRDDGYDISDYCHVHPHYGTLNDFRFFLREAHKREIRVIIELVINHTSDQHPWFQAARKAPRDSRKRDFYVWSDTAKKYAGTRIIFSDSENSNWTWDPIAHSYYWHRFFSHQPDLNFNNPKVIKAILRIMKFWLNMGIDGLRLDAIPYLCEREGTSNENLPETHQIIKFLRSELDRNFKNRVLLAEANQWPEDVSEYFGSGDECHMAYHFPLMPRMYMAVAMEDRYPIIDIAKQTPDIPENCQWAIFLRNHDELTLEMVTKKERDYMYEVYASDIRARLNLGIRRRLAPLMENDLARIRLMNGMLLSMPGSPIIYYGDEIGMGDNIFLGDRNGVRTPMQWSPDRNGGFSQADPETLYLPPIMGPIYGYQTVNVEAQLRNHSSLLNWMKKIIAVRKSCLAFGRGQQLFLKPENRKILVYLREYQDNIILCVFNLSRTAQPVQIDLTRYQGCTPIELIGNTPFPSIGPTPYQLTLSGYGFFWFKLVSHVATASQKGSITAALPEMPVLVLYPDKNRTVNNVQTDILTFLSSKRTVTQIEKEILPAYLPYQRWFSAKGRTLKKINFQELQEVTFENHLKILFTFFKASFVDMEPQLYFLPLLVNWEDLEHRFTTHSQWILGKARYHTNIGTLWDASGEDNFCQVTLQAMRENRKIQLHDGILEFFSNMLLQEISPDAIANIRRPNLEQNNMSVVLDDKFILKWYRRIQPGRNPELEMGRYLNEQTHFSRISRVAGAVEYLDRNGQRYTLGILQQFIENQGDGWNFTMNYLDRFLADCQIKLNANDVEWLKNPHGIYLNFIQTLGTRLGMLHAALAQKTEDPVFTPEPITAEDLIQWSSAVVGIIESTMTRLHHHKADFPPPILDQVNKLLAKRESIIADVKKAFPPNLVGYKTRYHGDFHLGHVLLVKNDFAFIDFEGESLRSFEERRRKHSPLKDVAGLIRSFSYAACITLRRVHPERPQDRAILEPYIREWARESKDVLLQNYFKATHNILSIPPNLDHSEKLLKLFCIEKAFYELQYEFDHRPEWLEIPLCGLHELLPFLEE
jgi:maltose alpha-D-glucosyltransferase/alpha-amylase